jgi:hypothetical protein
MAALTNARVVVAAKAPGAKLVSKFAAKSNVASVVRLAAKAPARVTLGTCGASHVRSRCCVRCA